jgi:hypothetical protein
MKMNVFVILVSLFLSMKSFAAERAAIYPFDVTVAGETAVIEGNAEAAIFAKLKKSVTKDAEVTLGLKEPGQIIVNVFPVDEKGVPKAGVAPKVIMVSEGTSFFLNKTMDESVLADGEYGMNIVSPLLGTSRVLFKVGAAKTPVAGGATQKTPEAALQMVFDAANGGDLAGLNVLLPPGGGEDGDVRNVCGVSKAPQKDKDEFCAYFKTGKIQGDARIDEKAGTAEVDFLFGPTGKKKETMNLVRKDGLWYLSSF